MYSLPSRGKSDYRNIHLPLSSLPTVKRKKSTTAKYVLDSRKQSPAKFFAESEKSRSHEAIETSPKIFTSKTFVKQSKYSSAKSTDVKRLSSQSNSGKDFLKLSLHKAGERAGPAWITATNKICFTLVSIGDDIIFSIVCFPYFHSQWRRLQWDVIVL